ncbi:phage holin family protein [Chloroflexia bacterium SDU3-3]|nr:phage holin family protein [Chloroflexia bacterium SDU3-3]
MSIKKYLKPFAHSSKHAKKTSEKLISDGPKNVVRASKATRRRIIRTMRPVQNIPHAVADLITPVVNAAVENMTSRFEKTVEKRIKKALDELPQYIEQATKDREGTALTQIMQQVEKGVRARINDMLADIAPQIERKVEQRIRQAASELREQAEIELARRQQGILLITIGMIFGALAALLVSFALAYVLITVLLWPMWAGFLLLGVLFALACGLLIGYGRAALARPPVA